MSEEQPEKQNKLNIIHRDLSWLDFNARVLEEATDHANPLLERLKFAAIFVGNLDEFFMVRVADLKRIIDSGYNRIDAYGYYPHEIYSEIRLRVDELVKKLYDIHSGKILRDLEKHNVRLKVFEELSNDQKKFVKRYFDATIFPIITPMAVDQGHPFPVLPSKTIAFAVSVNRDDELHLAILPIPANLGRVIKLPSEKDSSDFILLDEVIKEQMKIFFKGYKIQGFSLFRVIRDSEVSPGDEDAPNLLKAMENELKKRSKAKPVYLEIEKSCAPELLEALCQGIGFPKEEVMFINGTLDLAYLMNLSGMVELPQLAFRSFVAAKSVYENIFDKIKEGDFIIHLPYQSFHPVADLIQSAAKDEGVLAIKMTLYRANEDSTIINALKQAAKNKKQVTVLVEIKARFDEEKNILWVRELEQSGCHVIYGIPGLKIHSKLTLIVRKEDGRIRRYIHLSTGNYNEKTARQYTDIGYFTCNDDFGRDISDVFNVMTGYSMPSPWKRIVSSPNDLRKHFFDLIDNEIAFQKKNKNGLVFAKMNSLEDPKIIEKLYEASCAGVKIRLLVRGICCLVPGVTGLSENIEVRSVVGRFLEHSRLYLFNNNSNARVFMASADWMQRNFDRRIELMFEVYKQDIKEQLNSILETYWKDNTKARILSPEKTYAYYKNGEDRFNAQEFFINHYA
jgi:polyphosphate kinase